MKVGEKDKILYYASQPWILALRASARCQQNAAMIAAKSSAATPDKTGVNWRIVAHSSLSEEVAAGAQPDGCRLAAAHDLVVRPRPTRLLWSRNLLARIAGRLARSLRP